MTDLLRTLAPLLLPNLVLWGLIIGVLATRSDRGRPGRMAMLKILAALLLFLSVPAVPITAENLWSIVQIEPTDHQADAVVVLTAGMARYDNAEPRPSHESHARGLAAARVAREASVGLLISGGGALEGPSEAAVLAASLPFSGPVVLEETSVNTWENAAHTRQLLDAEGWRFIILVTDPAHARRAMASFRANRINVARFVPSRPLRSVQALDFIPSISGLASWRTVGHEVAGLVFYMANGWVSLEDL